MEYEMIEEKERALEVFAALSEKDAIAVDFEEECNLHMYGEHLSLIQIYDGEKYYVIDVLSRKIDKEILSSFFHLDVKKLWFDFGSDGAIVYKNYNEKIENVYDIRSYALALGEVHGLDKIKEKFLGIKEEGSKKKFQQLNWMRRPLDDSAILYALSDVKYLFELEKVLWDRVVEEKVEKDATRRLIEARKIRKSAPAWTKITDIRKLSKEEKEYLKAFFSARDMVARRFNVPASWVLGKKELVALALAKPKSMDDVEKMIKSASPRFISFLRSSLEKALEKMN